MQNVSANLIISTFIDLFVFVFNLLLIARVLLSYFVQPQNSFFQSLINLTEPLLVPIRMLLPKTAGVDFAPLATFFLLQGIQAIAHNLLNV